MLITKRQQVFGAVAGLSMLALAVVPLAASAVTANTTINATVGSAITVTSVSPVAISLTPTAGGVVSSASDAVTVNTNSTLGYTLTFADSDASANLVSGGNNITPVSGGTFASPVVLTNGTWGYRIVGLGGFGGTAYTGETDAGSSTSTWAAVPVSGSPQTIKAPTGVATNDVTTFWYGVKVNSSQPTGVYTDQVTYTATAN